MLFLWCFSVGRGVLEGEKNQWNGQVALKNGETKLSVSFERWSERLADRESSCQKDASRCGPGIWVEMVDCHIYSLYYVYIYIYTLIYCHRTSFFSKSPKLFRPPPSFKKALSSPKSWPNVSWIWCKSWRENVWTTGFNGKFGIRHPITIATVFSKVEIVAHDPQLSAGSSSNLRILRILRMTRLTRIFRVTLGGCSLWLLPDFWSDLRLQEKVHQISRHLSQLVGMESCVVMNLSNYRIGFIGVVSGVMNGKLLLYVW